MRRLNIGDKVRIKSFKEICNIESTHPECWMGKAERWWFGKDPEFTNGMIECCGKTGKIFEVCSHYVGLDVDGEAFYWHEDWLELGWLAAIDHEKRVKELEEEGIKKDMMLHGLNKDITWRDKVIADKCQIIEELKGKLDEKDKLFEELEQRNRYLVKDVAYLESRALKYIAENERLKQRNGAYKAGNEKLSDENKKLNNQSERACVRDTHFKKLISRREEEIDRLNLIINRLEAENKALNKTRERLIAEIKLMRNKERSVFFYRLKD